MITHKASHKGSKKNYLSKGEITARICTERLKEILLNDREDCKNRQELYILPRK
jgi:hypothetical protein